MKIIDKSKKNVRFMDLEIGDIFRYDKLYCINVENCTSLGNVIRNAVDIEDGHLITFSGSDEVQKVNATLIIGGEEE